MKVFVLGLLMLVPVSVMASEPESECREIHQSCMKTCVRDVVCQDECHYSVRDCFKAEARLPKLAGASGLDAAKRSELEAFRSKQMSDAQSLKMSERSANVTDKSYADKSRGERSCWVAWQSCLDHTDKAEELNACEVRRSSCLSIEHWRAQVAKKRLEHGEPSQAGSDSGPVMFGGVRK